MKNVRKTRKLETLLLFVVVDDHSGEIIMEPPGIQADGQRREHWRPFVALDRKTAHLGAVRFGDARVVRVVLTPKA